MASKFDKLADDLSKKPGIYDPKGLAYAIGKKKYGKAGMAAKAKAGLEKSGLKG